MAKYLLAKAMQNDIHIEREVTYPTDRRRCDLFISYNGGRDETYIELKCQNVSADNPVQDVFARFQDDIEKQQSLSYTNISGFCLAVVRCTFKDIVSALDELDNEIGAVSSAFLLDWETHTKFDLKGDCRALIDLATDPRNRSATFLLAVSP